MKNKEFKWNRARIPAAIMSLLIAITLIPLPVKAADSYDFADIEPGLVLHSGDTVKLVGHDGDLSSNLAFITYEYPDDSEYSWVSCFDTIILPQVDNADAKWVVLSANHIGGGSSPCQNVQFQLVIDVKDITVTSDSETLIVGSTMNMKAAIDPANATDKSVTWTVENGDGEATISLGGKLTGVKAGKVTVKATAQDGSNVVGTKEITITQPIVYVEAITVTSEASTLTVNKEMQMEAVAAPDNASDKGVTWTVENGAGEAAISSDGKLTGVKAGKVTVKAAAQDGSNVVGTKEITITEPIVYVEAITVTSEASTLTVNKEMQMEAVADPDGATDKGVTWTVENGDGEAVISSDGKLTGVKAGKVTVKATAQDGSNVVGTKEITIIEQEYAVKATSDGNGVIAAEPSRAKRGDIVTLTVTPNAGFRFKQWEVIKGDITITDNKFTMPATDVEIIGLFESMETETDKDELDKAKLLAEAAIQTIVATNDTTEADILGIVSNSISSISGVTASWTNPPVIKKAAPETEGSITGTITLSSGSKSIEVAVDKTIDKVAAAGSDDSNVTETDKGSGDSNEEAAAETSDSNVEATVTQSPKTGDTSTVLPFIAILFSIGAAVVFFYLGLIKVG